MATTFRVAVHADLELLSVFVRALYDHERIAFDAPTVQRALTGLMDNPALGGAWMIAVGETPVGYLVLTFGYSVERGGKTALLDELYIDSSYRGRGVGTEALDFAVRHTANLGVHAVHLEVARENASAQKLYQREGFGGPDRSLLTRLILPGDVTSR